MNIKDLIAQFKLGGQKTRFRHEDVLFILEQIDEHTQALEVRTINCIVIENHLFNQPVVKTFLSTDFQNITGVELKLKGDDTVIFVNETEVKSIILQLEGKLQWSIDELKLVREQMTHTNYWD